ncbi:DUF2270 domain-containing protein [uncultured Desulfuromonas sp.]|uniref:DUF2270 domain-containing protein n=1 Tax=uncultured Desulfuromonas sp. TaxID=181013 RepID=UPI00261F3191|nr:DUF2270 domain-containing protein [uncultured Desulfuromonas sp.]
MPEEKTPQKLTRAETITALAHYYRAEVQRSLAWRERLDRTTNWAVGTTAAFLGFGFSHPEFTHTFFVFGLAIVYILLFVESRRYRFFDAYEYRVRLLNQNFIYGILADGTMAEEGGQTHDAFWRSELASDLRYPQYKMGMRNALGRRLQANYIFLFAVLLSGWLLKIKVHPLPAESLGQYLEQASVGGLPGALTLIVMSLFALHLIVLVRVGRRSGMGQDILFPQK